MAVAASSGSRLGVDGKFFRIGEKRFYVKGVAYGPFGPNAADQPFASPETTLRDFDLLRRLGANLIRVYDVPPRWLLDVAADHELKVLIDIPWNHRLCFLDSPSRRAEVLTAVHRAVASCARHPALFGFGVGNEIPPDIARWSGARNIADFIDELIQTAKRVDPECLCTYSNFPSTEFIRPQSLDFVSFNVYLHQQPAFRSYLARLQMLAGAKPLLLSEFGVDSLREGEAQKCSLLGWQIEETFRAGLAGAVVFSFTDEWWHHGQPVPDWKMGLTTREREPKDSFRTVQRQFAAAPHFSLPRWPKVSVVVASYNGERTLPACLDSLGLLNYPDYEVILVDDGSTDATPEIAARHPLVRLLRHERNLGLSIARNTGLAAATGEIIAFTDSDCRADQDWLYYLVGDLLAGDFAGVGGPNLLPPEDSPIAAAVMASPGGPTHVMLTDRQAEHIPGCNMAFYTSTLGQVGGFDPVFRKAGDDVDLCWRLEQAGHKIGFSPSAFVWHYRRPTVGEYLRQQRGYGAAEALLVRKHPECFNSWGASVWRGRIYTSSLSGISFRKPMIYRGLFGSAGFQFLYGAEPAVTIMLCTSLEYHVFVTLPLWVLSVTFPYLLPLAVASSLVSIAVCVAAAAQASLPKPKIRWWSRPLVALLFLLQPIVRGWARYQQRLTLRAAPMTAQPTLESIARRDGPQPLGEAQYWAEPPRERLDWITEIVRRLDHQGWPSKTDIGWSEFDVEIYDTRWSKLQLTTATEDHPPGKQLLRCRLRGRWSLRAKIAFWAITALELVVLGFVGRNWPWLWLLLLILPLAAGFLRREQRHLQSLIILLLDQLARDWKLAPVDLAAEPTAYRVSSSPAPTVSQTPSAQPKATPGISLPLPAASTSAEQERSS